MRRTLVVSAAANELRDRHYVLDPVTGRYVRTVLLEPAATNLVRDSCNLPASGSAWTSTSNFTVSPAASIFAGQTAWRHQNLGQTTFAGRTQVVGTLTGQPETVSVVVENVDATNTAVSLFDGTAATHVCRVQLAWATGAATVVAGSGTAGATQLASAGPNGGPVYRIMVTGTGTAGNERRIAVYPSGTSQNTQTVIIHHVGHEVGPVATSPIVTTTAAVTRAADALTFPWPHAPGPYTGYLRFIELGAVAMVGVSRGLVQIGQSGQTPRILVHHQGTEPGYRVTLALPSSTAASSLLAGPAIGDLVELLWRLYPDGSVRIEQAINGGAPVVAARSSAIGLPAAWSGPVLGLSCIPGFVGAEAPAAWLGWAVEVGSADATWDYMRAAVGW